MSAKHVKTTPARTLRSSRSVAARGWVRDGEGRLVSPLIRCRQDEWYLVRARLVEGAQLQRTALLTTFLSHGTPLTRRCLWLHAIEGSDGCRELLAWVQAAPRARHMQVCVPHHEWGAQITDVAFHLVAERDPKCHPLANVPRWSTYRPPRVIQRVVLPDRLAALADVLTGLNVRILASPKSLAELRTAARGAACVLDPQWVAELGLRFTDLERLATGAWLLVDLATLARLLSDAGAADAQLVTHAAANGLMSARVEYADVPTRGLALQDVVPYATLDPRGRFWMRGLKANRSWRQYADETGFATLLSGETPWARKHGDVLSALRAVDSGELIATDLPWLVAGAYGPLLAPRLAAHLLRMHLAAPLAEHLQYWTRWDDANTIVRDIAELARHYAPLRAVQWDSADRAVAHLGLTLGLPEDRATRHIMFCTGRMDSRDLHDGLPPEPMTIFMKWLAREAREQTAWARQHLPGTAVTWQFDTADGLKYAANYDAAGSSGHPPQPNAEVVQVRVGPAVSAGQSSRSAALVTIPDDEGLHGDRSLLFQDTLTHCLRRAIETRPAGAPLAHRSFASGIS